MEKELNEIITIIQSHKEKAYRKINEELVLMYFEIGKYLSSKVKNEKWGLKIVETISEKIMQHYPKSKGFSRRGLYKMIQFYETYGHNIIVSPLVAQISWTNNLIILNNTKTIEEKEFYIRLCIANNYSKRELERQIKSGYYQRFLLSNKEFPLKESDTIADYVLDYYSLEFLNLPNPYSEKDLRKAIVSNLKSFVLEIGNNFTFVGEEYRVLVGDHDYYIDLLFYNRVHSCLVAFELKLGEFEPEYLSKMNFYLEALDRQERINGENPSVGIILCSSKDDTVVEYSLARNTSPTLIATYETQLIDKKKLEQKIKELRNVLENKND